MSDPVAAPPRTVRVFIAGNSGTGKTTFARLAILSQFHRQVILDLTGEWRGMADAEALTVRELQEAMQALARKGTRWKIVLSLDPDEFPQLVEWLVPVPRIDASPVRIVGGCVLLVDEVDLLAPQGTAKKHVRTLYRRSRHAGLSIVSTTQRPENVSREVSAQSTHAAALHLSEPRGVEYMRKLMRWEDREVAEWAAWVREHPHGGHFKNLLTGQAHRWADRPTRLTVVPQVSRRQMELELPSDDGDA